MPGTPIACSRKGAITNEIANTTPIVEPMIAIALVRWLSRVRSAAVAIATPEIGARALQHAPQDHHPRGLAEARR